MVGATGERSGERARGAGVGAGVGVGAADVGRMGRRVAAAVLADADVDVLVTGAADCILDNVVMGVRDGCASCLRPPRVSVMAGRVLSSLRVMVNVALGCCLLAAAAVLVFFPFNVTMVACFLVLCVLLGTNPNPASSSSSSSCV